PSGPMSSVKLIEDMDRQGKESQASKDGNWVIAPLPFRNELLGIGLVLGAGYLYGGSENAANARHSVAGAAGMYAEGGSWAALAAHRGYWDDQKFRTTVAFATGELLYDIEIEARGDENKRRLGQQFNGGTLHGAVRVGKNGWLGIGFLR